jgi:antirestriction protein ArdC
MADERTTAQPAAAPESKPQRDLRQEITDQLVQSLDAGKIPWDKPWQSLDHGLPRNMATGREYRGGNRLMLMLEQLDRGFVDPRFGTVQQINALGGRVRKGERGIPAELWKEQPFWERRDVNVKLNGMRVKVFGERDGTVQIGMTTDKAPTRSVRTADLQISQYKNGESHPLDWKQARALDSVVGRTFTVFNVEQCTDLGVEPLPRPEPRFDVVQRGEQIKAAMERDDLKFAEHPKFAFYSPRQDAVHLPPRGQFNDERGYYGTLLHEVGHATGAGKRLNREGITGEHRFGSEGYAREELRAEMFSMFMAAESGIPHDSQRHTAYIQSWAAALKKDRNEIFRAAAEASRAVDYVLGKEQGLQLSQERMHPVKVPGDLDDGLGDAPSDGASAARLASAIFVHKPGDGAQLAQRLSAEKPQQAKIVESREISTSEYDAFTENLFANHAWLDGKGGVESLPDGSQHRHVIEVTAAQRQTLLVDPSGHGYARIVGIPEADAAGVAARGNLIAPARDDRDVVAKMQGQRDAMSHAVVELMKGRYGWAEKRPGTLEKTYRVEKDPARGGVVMQGKDHFETPVFAHLDHPGIIRLEHGTESHFHVEPITFTKPETIASNLDESARHKLGVAFAHLGVTSVQDPNPVPTERETQEPGEPARRDRSDPEPDKTPVDEEGTRPAPRPRARQAGRRAVMER